MISLKIKDKKVALYESKQYPLLEKQHLIHLPDYKEGDEFHLTNSKGKFVAKGYFGNQNKGIGWVLSSRESTRIDGPFFKEKIKAAYDKRGSYKADEATNAYRIFNGEGDGIGGLTIDYYKGYMVVTWYSQGIYTYKPLIMEAVKALEPLGIYEKKRFDQKGKYIEEPSHLFGEKAPEPLIIQENHVNYAVYLDDGAMTGIFLDQKDVRGIIKTNYAKDKEVLNTFSYTGAFSVAAKVGGARKTTSVDLAKRSLDKTKEQFLVNDIDPETEDIVVMDVFNYFKWAIKKEKSFDLVVLDPPAFAKSKKMHFSVAKDYTWLMENAIQLCNDEGVIIASTNSSKLSLAKFMDMIKLGFDNQGAGYEILETYQLPEDFRYSRKYEASNYLKVIFVKVKK